MPHHKVKSFGEISRLNLKIKHVDEVEVTRAGSHYRARFRGRANSVFGATAAEAIRRLRSAQSIRWGISPKPITDVEHLLMKAMR